jgi:phenylalanyl-tRNA synthetase alpha chain
MLHPVSVVSKKIKSFLIAEGFKFSDCSEIVTTIDSFDNVAVAVENPTRDISRTFYIDNLHILRGHLTAQRNIIMDDSEKIANVIIGKVYRNCDEDNGHTILSHQCEGVTNMYELTLLGYKLFLEKIYFLFFKTLDGFINMPSFTRYASPAIVSYLICYNCKGVGCPLCNNTGRMSFAEGGIAMNKKKKVMSFCFSLDRLALKMFRLSDSRKLYS